MPRTKLTPDVLALIGERFKVLGEPARLDILQALRGGELTVTQLVDTTGLAQGNVSKHLQLLHAHGFVTRRKDGLFVHYALADRTVFRLCEIMCDRLTDHVAARRRLLAS
ncbi:MAG TPA: metalloregulator ArsR/SmtB family transcription factor [Gemmatimonadaceae bacterium]|nr:metalloregulator ArsR/SmtB family transcription factor [Gemmatimonadaceae bacterium]